MILFAEGFDTIFIGTGTHIPQEVRMENDQITRRIPSDVPLN